MIYFGEWMNVFVVRGGALLLPYSSFLALMQEKKQKKIKVPGAPAKLARYMIDGVEALGQVFTLLTVRSNGAHGRVGVWGG